jgi:predicted nucleic acid-binding protein
VTSYLDSSVLLRVVLGQRNALGDFGDITSAATSVLTEVECMRTLDRARVRGELSDAKVSAARQSVMELLAGVQALDLNSTVLRRAAQPMPTQLTTLDAIHLATALLWRETTGEAIEMATHDVALAMAARAHGIPVVGV